MYYVFNKTLLTDKGKTFAHAHESNYNLQLVYAKFSEYYTKLVQASLSVSNLLSCIASAHIDSSIWKGTTKDFILH